MFLFVLFLLQDRTHAAYCSTQTLDDMDILESIVSDQPEIGHLMDSSSSGQFSVCALVISVSITQPEVIKKSTLETVWKKVYIFIILNFFHFFLFQTTERVTRSLEMSDEEEQEQQAEEKTSSNTEEELSVRETVIRNTIAKPIPKKYI